MKRGSIALAWLMAGAGCYSLKPETDRLDAAHDRVEVAADVRVEDAASDAGIDAVNDVSIADAPDSVDIVNADAVNVDAVNADAVNADAVNADAADATDGGIPLPRIGSGRLHTCVLRTNGALRCWGYNVEGQLGNRSTISTHVPVIVDQSFFDGADLEGEFDALFVRTASGVAWGWGVNANGQLGVGGGGSRNAPARYGGITDVVSVAAGGAHACVVRGTGAVECSGSNQYGQLGVVGAENRGSPVPAPGVSDAVEVSAGDGFTCARRRNGAVLCWGRNNLGQLGCGTVGVDAGAGAGYPPCAVDGLNDAVELSSHADFTCARRAGGAVVCWGRNNEGQLGDGTRADRPRPVAVVGLSGVITLSTGEFHACAVTVGNRVSCWGDNSEGQIGDRSNNDATTPVQVFNLADAVDVACGEGHSCAVRRNGEAWCWGDNFAGQIGRMAGTLNYTAPEQVTFPN